MDSIYNIKLQARAATVAFGVCDNIPTWFSSAPTFQRYPTLKIKIIFSSRPIAGATVEPRSGKIHWKKYYA
jgi:hypothetical protein